MVLHQVSESSERAKEIVWCRRKRTGWGARIPKFWATCGVWGKWLNLVSLFSSSAKWAWNICPLPHIALLCKDIQGDGLQSFWGNLPRRPRCQSLRHWDWWALNRLSYAGPCVPSLAVCATGWTHWGCTERSSLSPLGADTSVGKKGWRGRWEVGAGQLTGLRLWRIPQAEFCFVLDLTPHSSYSGAPEGLCVPSVPSQALSSTVGGATLSSPTLPSSCTVVMSVWFWLQNQLLGMDTGLVSIILTLDTAFSISFFLFFFLVSENL